MKTKKAVKLLFLKLYVTFLVSSLFKKVIVGTINNASKIIIIFSKSERAVKINFFLFNDIPQTI